MQCPFTSTQKVNVRSGAGELWSIVTRSRDEQDAFTHSLAPRVWQDQTLGGSIALMSTRESHQDYPPPTKRSFGSSVFCRTCLKVPAFIAAKMLETRSSSFRASAEAARGSFKICTKQQHWLPWLFNKQDVTWKDSKGRLWVQCFLSTVHCLLSLCSESTECQFVSLTSLTYLHRHNPSISAFRSPDMIVVADSHSGRDQLLISCLESQVNI